MEFDPKIPPYLNSDKTSFAHLSVRDRWPVILTGAIDDVHRAINDRQDAAVQQEGKRIIEKLAQLKYEIQHDRQLTPIDDDGYSDVASYNHQLEQLGSPTWYNVPWLYSECYMYRRASTFFTLSVHWKSYDIFAAKKMSTFRSSRPAVLELAARYRDLIPELTDASSSTVDKKSPEEIETAERLLFSEICEICLWGNATDLSLLTNMSYEDIQKLQGSNARRAAEKNIPVNDLPRAFTMLKDQQKSGKKHRRVDIVLDNAGFELYVDLILAGYLLAAGLATEVVMHPKSIPWFVSDVLPKDFAELLNAISDVRAFYETLDNDEKASGRTPVPLSDQEAANMDAVFSHWSGLHQDGKLIIRPNRAWTGPGSYWRLPHMEKDLVEDLRQSELVLYKGDLNYRKLVSDAMWDPTTPFPEAIGPMGKGSGMRTMALRTCKADTIVGLPQGKDEEIKSTEGGSDASGARKWAWSGKWAVIQFCDGKQ